MLGSEDRTVCVVVDDRELRPPKSTICAFDGSIMPIAVRRLWGQSSTGPRGVADQSSERIRSPISPPPARKVQDCSVSIVTPAMVSTATGKSKSPAEIATWTEWAMGGR
jgi:hypothetical protein